MRKVMVLMIAGMMTLYSEIAAFGAAEIENIGLYVSEEEGSPEENGEYFPDQPEDDALDLQEDAFPDLQEDAFPDLQEDIPDDALFEEEDDTVSDEPVESDWFSENQEDIIPDIEEDVIEEAAALEEDSVVSGTCGENAVWEYDTESCVLTISGSGEIKNYSNTFSLPWRNYLGQIKSLVIGDEITGIGTYAFNGCTSLAQADLGKVVSIGERAFANCQALTAIEFPDGLEKIDADAFNNTGLKEISLPDSVTSLGTSCFGGCSKLKQVSLSNALETLPAGLFYRCTVLEEVSLPDSVTSMKTGCFEDCYGLTKVKLPGTLDALPARLFYGCRSLTEVTIPSDVVSIGENAFAGGLHRLEKITVVCDYDPFLFTGNSSGIIPAADGDRFAVSSSGQTGEFVKVHSFGAYLYNHDASCEQSGTMTSTCAACGKTETKEDPDHPATGHMWDQGRILQAPTPDEDGIMEYTCFYCGRTRTESVPAETGEGSLTDTVSWTLSGDSRLVIAGEGDTGDVQEGSLPWASASGSITTVEIGAGITSVGEKVLSGLPNLETIILSCDTDAASLLGEDGRSGVILTEDGTGFTSPFGTPGKVERIHAFGPYIFIPANCTEDAYRTAECGRCFETDTVPIPGTAKGHTWDEGVITVEPTVEREGIRKYTCTICSEKKEEPVARLLGQGSCGAENEEDMTWSLSADGVLVFHGKGKMKDYDSETDPSPFSLFKRQIKKVSIGMGDEDDITSIGSCAFDDFRWLKGAEISGSITAFGKACFRECISLSKIDLSHAVSIGEAAFYHCMKLDDLSLSENLTSLGLNAFYKNISLEEVKVPAGVTEMSGTFEECTKLKRAAILSLDLSMTRTFYNCSALETVTFPENANLEVGRECFYNCSTLQEIILPVGTTKLSAAAFYQCTELTGIDIPEGVTVIGMECFVGCTGLQTLSIPGTVTAIASGAFQRCHNIKTIRIPCDFNLSKFTANNSGIRPQNDGLHFTASGMQGDFDLIHDWDEAAYEWAEDNSTVTATRVCKRDASHTETETVNVTSEETRPATCEEMGETTYTPGEFTNTGFVQQQPRTVADIPAPGHDWDEAAYEWAEDNSTVTATRVCKRDASHTETETVNVTSEEIRPATCEEMGETTYTPGEFTNTAFAQQQPKTVDVPVLGHDHIEVPQTGTNIRHWTCSRCPKLFVEKNGRKEEISEAELNTLNNVWELISKLDPSKGLAGKDAAEAAEKAYEALSQEQKDLLGSAAAAKLKNAQEAVAKAARDKSASDKKAQAQAKFKLNVTAGAKNVPVQLKKNNKKIKAVSLMSGDSLAKAVSSAPNFVKASVSGNTVVLKGLKNKKKATITVTTKLGATISFSVKVQKGKIKTKKITVSGRMMKVGETLALETIITPVTTGDKLTFSSSNKKIATVGKKNGIVKAKKAGKVKITIKSGTKKKVLKLTVR